MSKLPSAKPQGIPAEKFVSKQAFIPVERPQGIQPVENKKIIKILSGVAVSDSGNKTVKVLVNQLMVHPLYGKRQYLKRYFLAHTDIEIKKGEKVNITPVKPISLRKSWKVVK